MTRVAPAGSPTKTAEGNTANVATNESAAAMATPGIMSGSVILEKRCQAPAPSMRPALSKFGSIPEA